MVWRAADVLEMQADRRREWLDLNYRITGEDLVAEDSSAGDRRRVQFVAPRGYVLWSVENLKQLTIDDCIALQGLVSHYEGVRMQKGEPCREDACDACKGADRACTHCAGSGSTWTLLELSQEEQQLAEHGFRR